eukprot:CAMPEP_0202032430 /NCGR_PEP_ID=MMETSP0905-20130828/65523_1 /ASSEMBLY_ACC=CAM_ASM_000554 /TAXON_ID=420261 /ORGANISM="Thalassiosira antarctica, Strain CCMP982" /LENGTH=35 /DNA_ID= /DNA_START= /DNA_END= /DNA_ORIENTATION=
MAVGPEWWVGDMLGGDTVDVGGGRKYGRAERRRLL